MNSNKLILKVLLIVLLAEIVGLAGVYFLKPYFVGLKVAVGSLLALVALFLFSKGLRENFGWVKDKASTRARDSQTLNLESRSESSDLESMAMEMRKRIYDLHNLFEISLDLTSILEPDRVINSYLLALLGQMGSNIAFALMPVGENKSWFQPIYIKGSVPHRVHDLKIARDDPLVEHFRKNVGPINLTIPVADLKLGQRLGVFRDLGIGLLAPLVYKNKFEGIIALGEKINRLPFSQSEQEIFSLLTNMTTVAFSNARLYQEMEKMSITDALTGLYNYRFFKKQLSDELFRARRFNHYVSLVIADVDHFKNYNDTFGHLAGDEVLKQLGQVIRNTARQGDIVSRYGGEEFCIILPEIDKNGAMSFGERLRRRVEETPFYGQESQPLGRVTISLGAASFPTDAKMVKELLVKADAALYRAKNSGRNCLCLYSTS